ncbi:hypothetical protein BS17DRAFT_799569 [Gyrodon lividus]|nr:hypothetical protein BS17DRAFT_799569 [Gyrodon lividus]
MNPANYDFSGTRAIAMLSDSGSSRDQDMHDNSERNSKRGDDASPDLEKRSNEKKLFRDIDGQPAVQDEEQRIASLGHVFKKALIYSSIFTLIVVIIGKVFHLTMLLMSIILSVPLPMFFSHYVFSRKFYAFWTACSIIWAFMSGTFCIILPLWESRKEMVMLLKATYRASIGAPVT